MYYKENTLRHTLSKRLSFKTTEQAKALMELVALRQGIYVADLVHGMFEQQAILHIDDVSDEQIRAVFKDAAKLS